MKKIFLKLPVFSLALALTAIPCQANSKLSEKETLALIKLETSELKRVLSEINKKLNEQLEEKDATPEKIMREMIPIKFFLDHPFVEADTGFSQKWYKAMEGAINSMIETKNKQRMAWLNRNGPDFAKYDKVFEKQVTDFAELSSKPVRVEKERLAILRKDARSRRAEIEKKLEMMEREERRKERATQ